MDTLIRCPRCKKKYAFYGAINEVSFCPECLIIERAEYEIVREYVKANKGCDITEVSNATQVSPQKIFRYLREEKLEVVGNNNFLHCEVCKAPINTGRFCQGCVKKGTTTVISKAGDDSAETRWRVDEK